MRKIYYRKRQEDLENRILLSTERYFVGLRVFYMSLFLVSVSAITGLLYFAGINYFSLTIAAVIGLVSLFIFQYLRTHSYAISVKEDTIIHTNNKDRSYVTSVKSIGKLRGLSIFGVVFTKYTFNLDGVYKTTLLVSLSKGKQKNPKFLLREIIREYKKEKANHKPGSVVTLNA